MYCGSSPGRDPVYAEAATDFAEEFVKPIHRERVIVESSPTTLLDAFRFYEPPQIEKWIDRDET